MSNKKDIPVFHPSFDFDTLMREAQKHITELAGDLWSDHNPSDPGITQLEVLAFCIADLSYRTSFDVKDIVAGYKGELTESHDLPLADVALPNNPVTIKDLRKLLVDMFHPDFIDRQDDPTREPYPTKLLVRNAFPIIAKENEVPFYAVSKDGIESFLTFDTSYEERLTLATANPNKAEPSKLENPDDLKTLEVARSKTSLNVSGAVTNATSIGHVPNILTPFGIKRKKKFQYLDPIELNGLYSIQIEFEDDLRYSEKEEVHLHDLNQNYFLSPIPIADVNYEISVLMPYWDDIRWSLRDVDINDQNNSLNYEQRGQHDYFIAVDKLNYDDYFYDYYAEVNLAGHKLPLYIKTQFRTNDNKLKQGLPNQIVVGGKTYRFTARFLDWNELANGVNRNYSGSGNPHQLKPNRITTYPSNDWDLDIFSVGIEGEQPIWDIKSVFEFKKEETVTNPAGQVTYEYEKDKSINLLTRIEFEEGTIIKDDEVAQIEAALLAKYKDLFEQQIALEEKVKSELERKASPIFEQYLTKINRVFELLYGENGIWSYLGRYRNLCEDFAHFSASRVQEVALFGDLIVAPNHNVNELLAEIYFRIDQFLSPLIKFNSLKEMVEKGYQFEDLFNGPLLQNGFIEDKDLNDLKRRSVVYTSDLIRIIMDVQGVEAVENFNISSYIDNRLMGRNVLNCLKLTNSDIYKPRFTGEKTRLIVWVNDEKQETDKTIITNWYDHKKTEAKGRQISDPDNSALNVPTGVDMEIEKYFSIQHDFPEVYGIGDFGLPQDATEERRARAKQLKAYLLPFEQLLANYLKQVAHLPELFSFSRNIDRTYYHQPLYEVPDVAPLFAPFKQSNDTWSNFKQDLQNAYQTELAAMESEADFRNRRNRFLNQLLARFGESFTAYATQMFDRNKQLLNDPLAINDYREANSDTLEKLIDDQISFAEDYPLVSGERYKAFDCTAINPDRETGNWNNSNMASYKRRLCRLLGIENVENKFIFQSQQAPDGSWEDEEGMHIVEHILLRPRTAQSDLLELRNEPIPNKTGSFIFESEKDPYSFRITIVLPRYAGRFKEKPFRQFTEQLIRMETPAHIRVDFRWMLSDCGKKFEVVYHDWKQNVYKLKPYFFRNIVASEQIDHGSLLTDLPSDPGRLKKPSKVVDVKRQKASFNNLTAIEVDDDQLAEHINFEKSPSILTLQNRLVQALQSTCELKLEAFNEVDQIFTPQHGKITFEAGKTDVFHLRVNEVGGVVTVYKMNPQNQIWESEKELKPITRNYFAVEDFLGVNHGLTTELGGRGLYKVVYEIEDYEPKMLLIEVTKTIVKPSIFIGRRRDLELDGEMLDYDTEEDGLFRISNRHWKPYFLQFDPASLPGNIAFGEEEIFGTAFIESTEKGLQKTKLFDVKPALDGISSIDLKEIYERFGFGTYHITYILDGQVTFAVIELFVELSISVFDGKLQLFPNADQVILIPSNLRKINLILDVPGGGLTVYDLDATVNVDDAPIDQDRMDGNPYGAIAYYKKIGNLIIDRDKETLYQDGHHYLFVYEHSGEQVRETLFFEAPVVEVKPPSVKLFEKGKEMTAPYVLMADGVDHNYTIEFHPKDAQVTAWIMDRGQEKMIENFTVPSDNYTNPIQPWETLKEHGSGPIFVNVKNDAGEVQLNFTIRKEDVEPEETTVMITNLATEEVVKPEKNSFTLVYDYQNPDQLFEMFFNNGDGELTLVNADGDESILPVEGNQIRFNGKDALIKGLPTGDYSCNYQPKVGNSIAFKLNVINLNPTFVLKEIDYKRPHYYGTGTPLYPEARSYIWRINGEYVSRAKNPQLFFDFGKHEKQVVKLTLHLEDFEASYELVVTRDLMKKWRSE